MEETKVNLIQTLKDWSMIDCPAPSEVLQVSNDRKEFLQRCGFVASFRYFIEQAGQSGDVSPAIVYNYFMVHAHLLGPDVVVTPDELVMIYISVNEIIHIISQASKDEAYKEFFRMINAVYARCKIDQQFRANFRNFLEEAIYKQENNPDLFDFFVLGRVEVVPALIYKLKNFTPNELFG